MSLHDMVIANASGATVRADINDALAALVGNSNNATTPTATFPTMWWMDSTANVIKIRNQADSAWITLAISNVTSKSVDIDAGSIDGAAIGANSHSTGKFTTLDATGAVNLNGGALIFNEAGADLDARFETNNQANQFVIDGGADGIGFRIAPGSVDANHIHVGAMGTLKEIQTVASSSNTTTLDLDTGDYFHINGLNENTTIANPSNVIAGQCGTLFITQDGTGSRTVAWGSSWEFIGGTAPTATTTASATDRVDFIALSTTSIHAIMTKAYS